jgi:NitT/TauT family transport system ATP-binding protein
MNSSNSHPNPADAGPAPVLIVDQISKAFDDGPRPLNALASITFQAMEGEFLCIVGPSGSGKSTLLRIVGGLTIPTAGQVRYRGQVLDRPHPDVGFVFQKNNLMPWRTVLENMLLPAEIQRRTIDTTERRRALDLLALIGLEGFAHAYPKHLSGGMSQRVVLARTLFQQPHLLLLDEPFGALDALTRERLNLELLRIHRRQRQTVLMVTHSISEAVFMADRVLVLSDRPGHIVAQVPVPLPRPRRLDAMADEQFGRLSMQVRHHIGILAEEDETPS